MHFRPPHCGQRLSILVVAAVMVCAQRSAHCGDTPPWSAIEKVVDRHFQSLNEFQPDDLIARGDVQPLLEQLYELGWPPPDAKTILRETLPDNDFLVVQLRNDSGRRFMRRISNQKLIYDQLDRIARESGGKALIRHLIRSPDGEQFVRTGRAATVPGMVELLPKQGSGKSRKVRDFDKPTGKIYTVEQLKARLKSSYEPKADRRKTSAAE